MSTQFQFTESTTYTDGSAIPAGTPLSYNLLVDTVNPPVQGYSVPAANLAAAVAGVVTVLFSDVGFVPVPNVTYYAAATEASGAAVSADSNVVSFVQVLPPSPPTAFTVL
ncbi:MAG: hypothetical protein ACLQNV_15230 [Steroidobacteraceae bacterium]|jgi:hypothetical protein